MDIGTQQPDPPARGLDHHNNNNNNIIESKRSWSGRGAGGQRRSGSPEGNASPKCFRSKAAAAAEWRRKRRRSGQSDEGVNSGFQETPGD